jgi:hypothetical protein
VAAKKKSLHAAERDSERVQQARTNYREMIGSLEVSRLKFLDESGVNLAMTRVYGGAPKGVRVVGAVPQNYGQQVTLLGALSLAGVGAVMTVEGATDAEVFRAYVKHVLGPTLVPGDIVVLNNLSVHKVTGIQQMLARRRTRLRYLPLLTRYGADRVVLVQAQNLSAPSPGPDAGHAGRGDCPSAGHRHPSRCPWLVRSLWICHTVT